MIQKRAVRIIENAKTASHTDPLFFKYKILKLNDFTEFNQATFIYKYTKKLLPSSFHNTFKKLGNFERSLNYQIDILNTGLLEYLPSYALLKIWNKLPLDLTLSLLGYLKTRICWGVKFRGGVKLTPPPL